MVFKSQESKADKKPLASRVISAIACAAAVCATCVFVIVPAARYNRAAALASSGNSLAAYEIFDGLGDYRDSAARRDGALIELCSRSVAERNYGQFNEFYSLISAQTSKNAASDALLETGEALYGAGLYESAFDCFSALDDSTAYDGAERCREARYNELVEEYRKTSQVPDGFESEMLAEYADADKYAVLRTLQSSPWQPGDSIDEIAQIYALGDFLGIRESGFAVQRLYGNSYSNERGYYFRTEAGDWDYNLPYTRYYGYYGLYSKFIDNVLLTGSDEKHFWVEQFRFTFADNDRTLHVYCYATGGTITLTKEQ